MEDIEDMLVGSGVGATPGFRLPLAAVGLNPKKKKSNSRNLELDTQSVTRDQLTNAPISPKVPGTQVFCRSLSNRVMPLFLSYMGSSFWVFRYADNLYKDFRMLT